MTMESWPVQGKPSGRVDYELELIRNDENRTGMNENELG